MPLEIKPQDDFSAHYIKAKELIVEHDITVLVGNRKFREAADRIHKAAIELERASILLHKMHLRKEKDETKRNS